MGFALGSGVKACLEVAGVEETARLEDEAPVAGDFLLLGFAEVLVVGFRGGFFRGRGSGVLGLRCGRVSACSSTASGVDVALNMVVLSGPARATIGFQHI